MSGSIPTALAALLGTGVSPTPQRVHGGCSNISYRFTTNRGPVFVKVAAAQALDQFEAEVAGLEALRAANALRVPKVLAVVEHDGQALLVLEWLELKPTTPASDRALGEGLARQHRVHKPLFGFKRHNHIGATPQVNFWSRNWIHFFREHRLEAQLQLAARRGVSDRFLERATLLLAMLDHFFTTYSPMASLLHGDLWSGNYAADETGRPVVFDPAAYYGDRECDLAMTRLFGGFGREFYAAYEGVWPLDTGWRERTELYNLYHVLNHFNLFGGGYLAQAEIMIDRLLAELGH